MNIQNAAQAAIEAVIAAPVAAVVPVDMPRPIRAVVLAPGALADAAALEELERHASPNGMILGLLADRPGLVLAPEGRHSAGRFLWVVATLADNVRLTEPLPIADAAEHAIRFERMA